MLAAAAVAGTAHAGQVQMPALSPPFAPDQHDYVFDCRAERPMTLSGEGLTLMGRDLPDGEHRVAVRATPGQALEWTMSGAAYRALCLPDDFPPMQVAINGPRASDFYALTPTSLVDHRYMVMLDRAGVPVWWLREEARPRDLKVIDGETVAYTISSNGRSGWYRLVGWDGVQKITIGATLGVGQHDLGVTDRGTYLVNRLVPGGCPAVAADCIDLSPWGLASAANPVNSEIAEFSADGTLLRRWSTAGRVAVGEAARWIPTEGEKVTHLNSIEPDGDGVLVTMRNADAVYRIDWATGDIDWKLGGTTTGRSLTVVGDPLAPAILGGPHDVRIVERRPGGVTRLSVSDNGTGLSRRPRAVVFDVDPVARTATFVEQMRVPVDAAPSSRCCGSSRALPGGGWLMTFGDNPVVSEMGADGTERLRITFTDGTTTYRAAPVLAARYPGVALAARMAGGMAAMHGRADAVVLESLVRPGITSSDALPLAAAPSMGVSPAAFTAPVVRRRPRAVTRAQVVGVSFGVPPNSTAQCRLNRGRWRACRSPVRLTRLTVGQQLLEIRTRSVHGVLSPPVAVRWRMEAVRARP